MKRLTDIEVFSLFINFLKENNAEENYKKYVSLEKEEIASYRYDLFCIFFDWRKSDEGWLYWSDLNKKWNSLLKGKEDGQK